MEKQKSFGSFLQKRTCFPIAGNLLKTFPTGDKKLNVTMRRFDPTKDFAIGIEGERVTSKRLMSFSS